MTNPIHGQSTAVPFSTVNDPGRHIASTTVGFSDTPSTISRPQDSQYKSGWYAAPNDVFEFFFGQNNIFSALLFGKRYDDSGLSAVFHILLCPISVVVALVNLVLLPIRIPYMITGLIYRQLERV